MNFTTMDYRLQSTAKEEYIANVDQTLRELQEKVQQHENELEKVFTRQNPQYAQWLIS